MSGVKGITGMHRFNICLVVLSLSCSGVKTPSERMGGRERTMDLGFIIGNCVEFTLSENTPLFCTPILTACRLSDIIMWCGLV